MTYAAFSDDIPEETRTNVQAALAARPSGRGRHLPGYAEAMVQWMHRTVQAWDGTTSSDKYISIDMRIQCKCAVGHVFPIQLRLLSRGVWCAACAYDRELVHSIEEMREIAASRRGICLSQTYSTVGSGLHWQCAQGHRWFAQPGAVLSGTWCPHCRKIRFEPDMSELHAKARAYGGECLSPYVLKETPMTWKCSEGHVWQAPWYIVKRGHWCKHCLATTMGRSIESMRDFAASKGGKCLSPEYLGSRGTLSWMCQNGHLFRGRPDRVRSGYWCAICLRETKTERDDEPGGPRKAAL